MIERKLTVAVAISLLITAPAVAATREPDWHAVIRGPVTDDMNNAWKQGQKLSVDRARETSIGMQYCSHRGSCLPRDLDGKEVVHLTDCKIGASIGDGDRRVEGIAKK